MASFDILPTQDFYDKYLPAPSWDAPLNERFNGLGFQSTFFLQNMGSMIIGLASIPLLSCILLALIPFSKFNHRIAAVKNKIHASLFWSQQIVLMNESYSMICLCTFINASHIAFTSKCEIVNSVLTITFIIICTAMPLLISVFLVFKLPTLGSAAMKR